MTSLIADITTALNDRDIIHDINIICAACVDGGSLMCVCGCVNNHRKVDCSSPSLQKSKRVDRSTGRDIFLS